MRHVSEKSMGHVLDKIMQWDKSQNEHCWHKSHKSINENDQTRGHALKSIFSLVYYFFENKSTLICMYNGCDVKYSGKTAVPSLLQDLKTAEKTEPYN